MLRPPQHLVFHLHQIVRIEEWVLQEQRIGNGLWASMQIALLLQDAPFRMAGHACLQDRLRNSL